MTQLIPQLKIDEAAKEYSLIRNYEHEMQFTLDVESFSSGVQFALNEIQPLMVELLDWMKEQPILICQTTNGHQWASSYMGGGYFTSQQLLEEFINYRTMKELEKLLEFESEEERQEFIKTKQHDK